MKERIGRVTTTTKNALCLATQFICTLRLTAHQRLGCGLLVLALLLVGCGGPTRALVYVSTGNLDGLDTPNSPSASPNIWATAMGISIPLTRTTIPSNDQPAWSPDGKKIAFVSTGVLNGNDASGGVGSNIWVMTSGGGFTMPLTRLTAADAYSPAWSPDKSKIAYLSTRALNGSDAANTNYVSNIWVMNADGSGPRPVTFSETTKLQPLSPIMWSPDSTRIAYRAGDPSLNIFVVNADASGNKQLTHYSASGASAFDPVWSPNGGKIAFVSEGTLDGSDNVGPFNAGNVWVMNSDGSGATPLTRLTGNEFTDGLSWSPDGSKIVFSSNRPLDGSNGGSPTAPMNVWIMNADGSAAAPLTKLTSTGFPSGAEAPAISPDGTMIAFVSDGALNGDDALNKNSVSNVWTMNSDGSNQQPITKYTAAKTSAYEPVWHP
ncbi:MAG TPA: hypothetical protein VK738_14980 [Terriglobales bacterium]|nr:hypothetical protein [Terriglobales bacterium]